MSFLLLELLLTATCVVGPGVLYEPPQGWTLRSVAFTGQVSGCSESTSGIITCTAMVYPRYKDNTVTVTRTVQVGEQVKAPEGCQLTSEAKEAIDERKSDLAIDASPAYRTQTVQPFYRGPVPSIPLSAPKD
jgi:hypothetical protein